MTHGKQLVCSTARSIAEYIFRLNRLEYRDIGGMADGQGTDGICQSQLKSELFGYVKGAFTGAKKERKN